MAMTCLLSVREKIGHGGDYSKLKPSPPMCREEPFQPVVTVVFPGHFIFQKMLRILIFLCEKLSFLKYQKLN